MCESRRISCVPGIRSTPDEKKLFSRLVEVYAGFSEYTDAQVGRIIDYLESTGQLDNTVVLYCRGQRRLRRRHRPTARSTRTSSSTATRMIWPRT
ncbi:MAG: sulfatase-like hydrolase/transferase [Comamonadaceae bacterium]|nr:sulfatase-like hydrolase/transferase [Comamonadaceae bacterium]